ncbi:MAG TPA: GlxA family transcriptional regulator [Steroidobacteraceae bacterium]|nr:GlxA family transcriptional regulator [Steroidobacteraceae bacterium]
MQRIGFVVPEGFQMIGLAAQAVFEYSNRVAGKGVYEVRVLSEKGGAVRSSLGIALQAERLSGRAFDTLIVIGTEDASATTPPGVLNLIRRGLKQSRRVASICTGAFILGEAGLLEGRRATTHWFYARELQRRFPEAKVEGDRIFIIDGPIWTSAGATAGLDLALAMVEKDLGSEVSRSVAKKLVMHHRRAGGQSQHSELLALSPKSDRIQNALSYAEKNLGSSLSVDKLAGVASLSPRQFSRAFQAETGQTPAKAVEKLRLEAARLMIEQSHHPIDVVARETGFVDRRRMREAFLRTFGQPPQVIRRNARTEARG